MKTVIYRIPAAWPGELAILARPRGGEWLNDEVEGWRDAGVQVVVSLLAEHEAAQLGLAAEAQLVQAAGLRFISFPIRDYDVPTSTEAVRDLVGELDRLLGAGKNVGIHCRGCIGRSSVIAACLLLNNNKDSEACFEAISKSRGVPVPDTLAQREWVGHFARM